MAPRQITGHRGKRQKARSSSRLEDIAGIGPRRRASLLRHFGGLSGLKAAAVDDIARVEGVNRALAERIWASLHGLDASGVPQGAALASVARRTARRVCVRPGRGPATPCQRSDFHTMILALAATEIEMQPFLRRCAARRLPCRALVTGVGPLESAVRVAAFLGQAGG